MAKAVVRKIVFAAALEKALEEVRKPATMKRLGDKAAGMIKLRTRLGHGVTGDGTDKQKLKPLSDSTRESKRGKLRRGELSSDTTPNRSNLTDTGQLLDSIKAFDAQNGSIKVGPTGTRQDGKRNEDIAKYVTEQGRSFNHLSKVEQKRINDEVRREVRAVLKRYFSVK